MREITKNNNNNTATTKARWNRNINKYDTIKRHDLKGLTCQYYLLPAGSKSMKCCKACVLPLRLLNSLQRMYNLCCVVVWAYVGFMLVPLSLCLLALCLCCCRFVCWLYACAAVALSVGFMLVPLSLGLLALCLCRYRFVCWLYACAAINAAVSEPFLHFVCWLLCLCRCKCSN